MTATAEKPAPTRAIDETFLKDLPPEARNAYEIAILDIRMHAVEKWQAVMDARMWVLVGAIVLTLVSIVLHTLKLIA